MSGPSETNGAAWRQGVIPGWLKLLYTAFLCLLVPVYWVHYGPANFLWASDIALFLIFVAVWLESPLPNSMMAIGVMPFELVWALDFFSGASLLGATAYMFEGDRSLLLRGLSLYHLCLPPIIFFLLYRLGYDRRALLGQTLLVWLVLPVCYLITEPADNINFVFGPGRDIQTFMHPLAYLLLEMFLLPVAVCLPAHLILRRFFASPASARHSR